MPWAYARCQGGYSGGGIVVLHSRSSCNAPAKHYQPFFKSLKVVSALEKRSSGKPAAFSRPRREGALHKSRDAISCTSRRRAQSTTAGTVLWSLTKVALLQFTPARAVKVFPAPLPPCLAACFEPVTLTRTAFRLSTIPATHRDTKPHKEDLGELGETECARLVLHLRTNERTVNRGLQAVHFATVSPQG